MWDGLVAEGYSFSRCGALSEGVVRIACAFDTTVADGDALVAAAHRYAGTCEAADRAAPAMRSAESVLERARHLHGNVAGPRGRAA